jgi:hypothetical protein
VPILPALPFAWRRAFTWNIVTSLPLSVLQIFHLRFCGQDSEVGTCKSVGLQAESYHKNSQLERLIFHLR